MKLNPVGLVLIAISLALPVYWFLPLSTQYPNTALFSQYIGIAALIVMAWIQLIATRLKPVETIFGPLDQVYRLHKWLGISALLLVVLHEQISPEIKALGADTQLSELGESLGEQALNGFYVLIIASVLMLIPYRYWYLAHRFIGLFYALSAGHYLLVLKPFGNMSQLGWYTTAFCALGILAYLYKLTPKATRMRGLYRLEAKADVGGATELNLAPEGHGLRHKAGQFAYLSFDAAGKKEVHPFTISNAPNDENKLRFSVAPLGDFTKKNLATIDVGTPVFVEGAFGRFLRKKGKETEIWIAGGIGITPFLAWAQAMTEKDRPALLVYCVKTRAEAAYVAELEAHAARLPNLDFILWESQVQGRVFAHDILAVYQGKLPKTHVHFCGPAQMRDSLKDALSGLGLPKSRFHAEDFEMRTGIGIERLVSALLTRSGLASKLPSFITTALTRSRG